MDDTEDRTPPERVRLSGLQDVQLDPLAALEAATAAMYYEAGFGEEDLLPRNVADLGKLGRTSAVTVAEADYVVAGYVAWRDEAPGVAVLEDLAVHPDFQRFGIATKLLYAVLEKAHGLGIDQIVTISFERAPWAAGFLAKQGFRPVTDDPPQKIAAWLELTAERISQLGPGRALSWRATAPDA